MFNIDCGSSEDETAETLGGMDPSTDLEEMQQIGRIFKRTTYGRPTLVRSIPTRIEKQQVVGSTNIEHL